MTVMNAREYLSPELIDQGPEQLAQKISPLFCIDESALLQQLILLDTPDEVLAGQTEVRASELIKAVRGSEEGMHMVDALLQEYNLDTQEGIVLMCLAEALMRIPDNETADALIRDRLTLADWRKHLRNSDSPLVNASTWCMLLTGKVLQGRQPSVGSAEKVLGRLVSKLSEPVIRTALNQAMKIMGKHFVLGTSIEKAIANGKKSMAQGYSYSFDMLGEAAISGSDAEKYFNSYRQAIIYLGSLNKPATEHGPHTISIKLSALHPRYEALQKQRVLSELFETVLALIVEARRCGVGITIDAEEADRLEISLVLFEKLYRHPDCRGWGQLGLVVQAYSKRAMPVLAWLAALAKQQGDGIPLRLVKGAYWDSEIKHAQQLGLDAYPVFTRKEATDVSYLACARFLLQDHIDGLLYPQFASHNVHTVASVLSMAKPGRTIELQHLHGMGDALHNIVLAEAADNAAIAFRIYAPVGNHKDLLPYLVRRLLENGANSSFVHRLVDATTPVSELTRQPAELLRQHSQLANPLIPLPPELFAGERKNSRGISLAVQSQWQALQADIRSQQARHWGYGPMLDGEMIKGTAHPVCSPQNGEQLLGHITFADPALVERAINSAEMAFTDWNNTPVEARATVLQNCADLLEKNRAELITLCQLEAGKTIQDAIDEVREAVDFCRYYAVQAIKDCQHVLPMPGPTGEANTLSLTGRGVFACISPWNFPLAIFLGQVSAALVSGNTVIAKPAEQTSLIAGRCVELLFEAGLPKSVLQFLPGPGSEVGPLLSADKRVAGVVFTGSTQTAQSINRSLAARDGAIVPLIAETGGQNAMLVDSTALPEQLVKDVIQSAFASAGQRCSALRVLYVQVDIADRICELLAGAMQELIVADPSLASTDVGPVIDEQARQQLLTHITQMKVAARLIAETPLPASCDNGSFVVPIAFEIDSIGQLKRENFGPVLHVIRYRAEQLDEVIDAINGTGYGLTLGIHSRNESRAAYIADRVRAGNVYINRNQIGAMVGVQPFGGQGLSGTGPKAGGPHYLPRFMTERTRSINTTSIGGNASLLSLGSGEPKL